MPDSLDTRPELEKPRVHTYSMYLKGISTREPGLFASSFKSSTISDDVSSRIDDGRRVVKYAKHWSGKGLDIVPGVLHNIIIDLWLS